VLTKKKYKKTKEDRLREQVLHLAVDLEYAGRQGDSAYSARVNKKLDKLYNKLDTLHDVSEG